MSRRTAPILRAGLVAGLVASALVQVLAPSPAEALLLTAVQAREPVVVERRTEARGFPNLDRPSVRVRPAPGYEEPRVRVRRPVGSDEPRVRVRRSTDVPRCASPGYDPRVTTPWWAAGAPVPPTGPVPARCRR